MESMACSTSPYAVYKQMSKNFTKHHYEDYKVDPSTPYIAANISSEDFRCAFVCYNFPLCSILKRFKEVERH